MTTTAGKLWIVATPIGNLEDLSPRARDVLAEVDLIAAEDTRHSAPLLRHFGIGTRCIALHEHNERDASDDLVNRMRDGTNIALISDAGTPLISDPGFRLVRAARGAGIDVSTVPGPCAAIAALSIAGLPSDRFVFEGFLPPKSSARRSHLESLRGETRTLIFYESSHRILDALRDAAAVFGERRAIVARELTKLYETVLDGTLPDLCERVAADTDQQRGEFVVLIAGSSEDIEAGRLTEGKRVFELLRGELPPGRAAKLASEISGAPRNALYAVRDDK
ncbi:MAG TPA: 16S rRNA (cytidine(1402)-2'-O)-methyltransferase [Rudaea sp.]|jgi:16S rRNA (cytidine1402-2'-O)-methyltransferase|nr:16S rRNA (cytidine(1402)-2'-O)-methyltransferase [Rudaea sp.]